jgi:hypothetical protein
LWMTRLETVAACSLVIVGAQAGRARRIYRMFLPLRCVQPCIALTIVQTCFVDGDILDSDD